jgi:hypothetical protein
MATVNKTTGKTQAQNSNTAGLGVTAGSNLQDLLALKKKLIQQNEQRNMGGKTYLPWIKIETGKTVKVRILPLTFNNNMPFITVKEHRNLYPDATFRAVVCPRSVGGGECPICEYIDEHYRKAKEDNDQGSMTALRPLFGKPRAYAVLYNRVTKQIEKIGMSTTLLGQILSEIGEGESTCEDPTDVLNGCDGKISAVKGANGFNSYNFHYSEISSPLFEDEEDIKKIMDELEEHSQEILKLKTPLSYDEIKALLSAASTDDIADDNDDEEKDDSEISDDDVANVLASIKRK